MRVLSLFDGISCARVALERAGIPVEVYYASEIDKYAIQVSQNNYPDIVRIGNVVDFDKYKQFSIMSDFPDLLIGGSPCQDLSIAKKDRKGLDGEKSGLFWEYIRILKETKPRYFILENVASMSQESKQAISKAMFEASRYSNNLFCDSLDPIMIDASLVSAQNRKRLFWTNIPNITLPKDRNIFLRDILENEVDEKYIYSEKNKINTNQGNRVYGIENKSVTLKAKGGGGGAKTGLYVVSVARRNKNRSKHQNIGLRYGTFKKDYQWEEEKNGKSFCVKSATQEFSVKTGEFIRKLTPIECERLQGLPDNYTEGLSNTQRYSCLGNAFNVDVIAHILSFISHERH